jgi:hypothetical protein
LKGEGDPFAFSRARRRFPTQKTKKALTKSKLIKDCIKTRARAKKRVFRVLYIHNYSLKKEEVNMVRDSLSLSELISFSLSLFYQTSLSPRAWMEAMRAIRILFISLSTAHFASQKREKSGIGLILTFTNSLSVYELTRQAKPANAAMLQLIVGFLVGAVFVSIFSGSGSNYSVRS